MKKKIASLLLMLTLIMCQMPAMVFANDMPADVPPADQQEQTVGQDGQNDKNDQNGQPAVGQENIANTGGNEEGTDGQKGDDVSKEQITGSDASGTDETNGGGSGTANEGIPETSGTGPVPEDGSKLRNTLLKTNSVARFYVQATTGGAVVVKNPATGDVQNVTTVNAGDPVEITNNAYFPVSEGDILGLNAEVIEGYTFDGWYTDWNSTNPKKVSSNASITYTLSTTNSETYTAYFKSNSDHVVTFDTRGHYAAVQQQTVADGGKATKPNSPADDENATDYTTTGLHFRNWSELSPSELTPENFWSSGFDFKNTTITADKKLYAISWAVLTLKTYDTTNKKESKGGTITYSSPYSSGTETSIQTTIIEGTQETLTATASDGYEFVGWAESPTGDIISSNSQYTFTNNGRRTVYALFASEQVKYLGTGRNDGGTLGVNAVKNGKTVAHSDDAQMTNFAIPESATVTLTATAGEGYVFKGWYEGIRETDPTKPGYGHVTDYNKNKKLSDNASYSFTLSQDTNAYALFEKPPVLTLHWSSVDGKDLMDPIKIEVPKGTTITQAFTGKGWTLEESRFTKNGYKDSTFRTNKPITDYTSEAALQSDLVQGTTQINADTDIYYIMYKEIGTVSGGIESPVCGTEAGNTTDTAPYGQTNAPKVSVPSGSNYQLEMVDSKPYAFWAGNKTVMDPFTDKFKGEESYYARFKLNTSFGYVFAGQPTVSIDNASDVSYQVEDNNAIIAKNLVVVGAVKAVHDWGDWEVTKDPTETEEGLEERTCKTVDCGAHEERTIPKLVVEYRFVSGDGSSWTRGSTEKLNFVVKRNRADETTVDHFKGLKVDGKEVPSSGYAAKAGSIVIDLMPAYLGTLADGDHTLTAVFDDGNKETSASFKVLSAADKGSKDKANSNKKGSPATGDEAQMLIWLMILCTAGLALSDRIIRRLKNDSADR